MTYELYCSNCNKNFTKKHPNIIWRYTKNTPISYLSEKHKCGAIIEKKIKLPTVDVVYTWYNSNDIKSQKTRFKYQLMENPNAQATSNDRFNDIGELKYSIRGVYKYMSWVRYIWIVIADDQKPPDWFKNLYESKVKIVRHSEIFTKEYVLPTYNSLTIESALHRIPRLAEKFIYFNDDIFVNKYVDYDTFFTETGKPKIWLNSNYTIDFKEKYEEIYNSVEQNALLLVKNRLGDKITNRKILTYRVRHFQKALTKKVMKDFEKFAGKDLLSTKQSRFRKHSNIYGISGASHLGIQQGTCEIGKLRSAQFIGLEDYNFDNKYEVDEVYDLISNSTFFCLNNSRNEIATVVVAMLEKLYPSRSINEK